MLRNLITRRPVSVGPDVKISEVARLMEKENVGSVLVLADGRPVGILTDRDIVLRCLAKNINVTTCPVKDAMTKTLATCRDTDGVFDCIRKMRDERIRRMPVVDADGKAVGLLSFGDILSMLSREVAELTKTTTIAEEVEPEQEAA